MRFALAGLVLLCGMAKPAEAQRVVKRAPVDDISAQGSLALLNYALQYPPGSMAIDNSYWDLLHPWNVDTPARPMHSQESIDQAMTQMESLHKAGLSAEEAQKQIWMAPASLKYQFEMNKTIVAGTQDQLQARLTVTSVRSSNAAPKIQVGKAEMIGSYEFGTPNLGEVPYSCDASSPTCTFMWHAPSEDKQYWGVLRLRVTLTVDGLPGTYVAYESFYSSPMVAGMFTGKFKERLDNGSLVIDAGVDIQKHMACFVSANLYSVDQATPLQHVRRSMLVDPSMNTISFTFFGKIFRDYGDQGIFRLQDLQGQCVNLPYPPEWFMDYQAHRSEVEALQTVPPPASEPTRIYFAYNNYSYTTTHSYPNSAFSNAEWQSPEKTRRLEMYRKIEERKAAWREEAKAAKANKQ